MAIPDQVGDPHVVKVENVVLMDQPTRRLVVQVLPLPPHLLMVFGQKFPGPLAALAPFLPAGEAFLGVGQPCP